VDEAGEELCVACLIHQTRTKSGTEKSTWHAFFCGLDQVRKNFRATHSASAGPNAEEKLIEKNMSHVMRWQLKGLLPEEEQVQFKHRAQQLATALFTIVQEDFNKAELSHSVTLPNSVALLHLSLAFSLSRWLSLSLSLSYFSLSFRSPSALFLSFPLSLPLPIALALYHHTNPITQG